MPNFQLLPSQELVIGVLALLCIIALICKAINVILPETDIRDFTERLFSWWIVFGYLALIVLSPALISSLLVVVILLQSLHEYSRALGPANKDNLPHYLFYGWLILFSLTLAIILVTAEKQEPLIWFCCAVLLTQLNDVYQYVCGKIWGSRKITPTLSPNKTLEGVIGGMCFTVLTAIALCTYFLAIDFSTALLFGLLVSILGFFGDITFSALKRRCEIKDFGNIFPGFGGLLDRLDSCTFTLPVGFFFYLLVSGGSL